MNNFNYWDTSPCKFQKEPTKFKPVSFNVRGEVVNSAENFYLFTQTCPMMLSVLFSKAFLFWFKIMF